MLHLKIRARLMKSGLGAFGPQALDQRARAPPRPCRISNQPFPCCDDQEPPGTLAQLPTATARLGLSSPPVVIMELRIY
jgi:hypothetical protein